MKSLKPAGFSWWQLVLGLPAGLIHGLLIAWLAASLQTRFAPWLLFPILMGLLLGATFVGLLRLTEVGHRWTILLVLLFTITTTIVGQHYLGYRRFNQVAREEAKLYQKAQQIAPKLLQGRPIGPAHSFAEFLRWEAARGRTIGRYTAQDTLAWLSWGLDGLLLSAAALALVVPALRQPYCGRCRSWFHNTRAGQIDLHTAQQLAALLEVPVPDGLRAARYRLIACTGGCGPTGLELRWDAPSGPTRPMRFWLDVEPRNQVMAVLDGTAREEAGDNGKQE
jgi:hypothetical protein